jgi:hypothetical protein
MPRSALWAGLSLLSILCPRSAGAETREPAFYEEHFDTGPAGFYYYPLRESEAACDSRFPAPMASPTTRAGCYAGVPWLMGGFIRSHSPYWIDPNHRRDVGAHYPGAGYLNVVAFQKQESALDLRGATLRVRLRLHENANLRGAHLHFYSHSSCRDRAGRPCEFRWTDNVHARPLEASLTPGEWTDVEVVLRPIDGDWICLGSQIEQSRSYGCLPMAEALASVESIGFLLLPVPTDPDGSQAVVAELDIDDVVLRRSAEPPLGPVPAVPASVDPFWTRAKGVRAEGRRLIKTADTNEFDSGAVSREALHAGGSVRFRADGPLADRVVGLGMNDMSLRDDDVDYALHLTADGYVFLSLLGSYLDSRISRYKPGDRFRVSVIDGLLEFRQNNYLLHSSKANPAKPLRVDVSLKTPGARVSDVEIFPPRRRDRRSP